MDRSAAGNDGAVRRQISGRQRGCLLASAASALFLAAAVFGAGGASAQAIDLSTLKCREFAEFPKDTVNAITMWLDGYLTDEEDPAVIDLDKMKAKAEKLAAYCVQNPKIESHGRRRERHGQVANFFSRRPDDKFASPD